jgi:hypothetical protein
VLRTQPIRSPAQIALLAEPTVITVPPWSNAAIGRTGGCPGSRTSSAIVSSATTTVPAARAASTSSRRWSSPTRVPVGLW